MERIITRTPTEVDFILNDWSGALNADSIASGGSVWTGEGDTGLVLSNDTIIGSPAQKTRVWHTGGAVTIGNRPTVFVHNKITSAASRIFQESVGLFIVQYNLLPFIIEKEVASDYDYTFNWAPRLAAISGDQIATSTWATSDPALRVDRQQPAVDTTKLLSTVFISDGVPAGYYYVTNTITTTGGRTLQYTVRVKVLAQVLS